MERFPRVMKGGVALFFLFCSCQTYVYETEEPCTSHVQCKNGLRCIEGLCQSDWTELEESLYGSCAGLPFNPVCDDLSCVAAGDEAVYFEQFHDILLEKLSQDEKYLQDHVRINDVQILPDGDNRLFRVDYLFVYDWVRVRLVAEVKGLDPFSLAVFRRKLTDGSEKAISVNKRYSKPFSIDQMEQIIGSCNGLADDADWCDGFQIQSSDGVWMFNGRVGYIDEAKNQCRRLKLNVESGSGECSEGSCSHT
jgi:hypothetical protein